MARVETAAEAARAFDPAEGAGLFVGVRKFAPAGMVEVPFAVDDAVDLAYMFALDPRVRFVRPQRVVLALSGTPQKEVSQRRLEALKGAGANVRGADYRGRSRRNCRCARSLRGS